MADVLRKVLPGQKLRLPAATFNTFVDTAKDYLQRRQSRGGDVVEGPRWDTGVLLVRNDTGVDLSRFSTVALSGVVITPDENMAEYLARPCFKGVLPTEDDTSSIGVLLSPLKAGAIGPAAVDGVCIARVDMQAADDRQCGLPSGQSIMRSGSGPVQILWATPAVGEQLAIVRLLLGGTQISIGQYRGQVYQMVADQEAGWEFPMFTPALPTE